MRRLGVCSSLGCRAKRRGWLVRVPSREIEYELISLAIQLPILSFFLSLSLSLSFTSLRLYLCLCLFSPISFVFSFSYSFAQTNLFLLPFSLICASKNRSSIIFHRVFPFLLPRFIRLAAPPLLPLSAAFLLSLFLYLSLLSNRFHKYSMLGTGPPTTAKLPDDFPSIEDFAPFKPG